MAEARDSQIKQLDCPICLEKFISPNFLPCMHTFCEKCICKHASDLSEGVTKMTTISCPVCRSPIPAPTKYENPQDWAAKLPNNSVVLSLSASKRADSEAPVHCEACLTLGEQHISMAFCVTCSEYLCQTCYNCHKTFKISRDHQITVHSTPEHLILNSTQDAMYICQIHNEKLTYVCSEHKETCCMQCVLKDHRKCKQLLSLEGLGKNFTESHDFKQALENLNVLRKMFNLLTDNRTKTLETIEQQKSDVLKSIKDWSNLVKDRVNQLETTIIQELEQICKEGTITISDEVVECKSAIAAIETSQTMLIESTKSDDARKILVTLTKVSQQLLSYLQKYDRIENRSNEIVLEFHLNKNLEEITQTPGSLGRVSSITSRIAKLSPDCSFEGILMMPSRVQLNATVTFDAKTVGDKELCNIILGAYLPDKRIVLYDAGNEKIKLFDKYFHFVSYLDWSSTEKPQSICIVDKGIIAISTGNFWGYTGGIVFMSVTNSINRIRKINVGKECFGIASYKQNLMVCAGGDSILTYDASYEVSKRIRLFDSYVYRSISVSPDGQGIYYTVQDQIVTMDTKGKKLETFKSDVLKGVVAITVDKKGIIYCCGQKSNNVVLFSPEGRQLCVLLSHEHGLKNPSGIYLNDRNTKILVFHRKSSEIKVFTLV